MNKTQQILDKLDEMGKDFHTFKADTAAKKTGGYDAELHKQGMHLMGDTSKFSKHEKTSMQTWTDPSGYKSINGHLRGTSPSRDGAEHVKHLDSAMEKTHVPEKTDLYRGIHGPHHDNFSKLKPGDTFHNKGYTATTIDPRRASHYTRDGGSMLHVSVPEGHKALYVSHPEVNGHTSEREVLLPHHTHFQYNHSEQVTVPEHHYSGSPTGRTKSITVHHVSVVPSHDMSHQLDKV